jgi:CDP-glucose 4,6-dehydratase
MNAKAPDFAASFRGRRVLVTGSTGFKGSWLCTWLVGLGAHVTGFALPPEADAPLFEQLGLPKLIRQIYGDVRDAHAVAAAVADTKPDVIVHLAAQALVFKSYSDPKLTFDTNVGGAINLLEAVRGFDGLKSLVFITSDKCYQNNEWIWGYRENDTLGGADPYSASKAAAEMVFEAYASSFLKQRVGLLAATARAGNVIGGGDMSDNRVVPDCIRALRGKQAIVLRQPQSTRPWQHVLEPLSGYLLLASRQLESNATAQGAWNFGPNAENVFTVGELARAVVRRWGEGEVVIDTDTPPLREARLLQLSNDKAKTALGWRPRWTFQQVVDVTVDWYARVDAGEDPRSVTQAQIAAYESAPY